VSLLRGQPADHCDAVSLLRDVESRPRGGALRVRDRHAGRKPIGDEGNGCRAHPAPQRALQRAGDGRNSPGEVSQDAGGHLVGADCRRAPGITVERRHHGNARKDAGDDGDEQRLEVVRVQQPDALLDRHAGHRARTAEVEPGRALESHRRQTAAPGFLRQGDPRSRPPDGTDDRQIGTRRRCGERKHGAIGTVEGRSLPEMKDGNHDRAASSR